jgi:hypothetical protein
MLDNAHRLSLSHFDHHLVWNHRNVIGTAGYQCSGLVQVTSFVCHSIVAIRTSRVLPLSILGRHHQFHHHHAHRSSRRANQLWPNKSLKTCGILQRTSSDWPATEWLAIQNAPFRRLVERRHRRKYTSSQTSQSSRLPIPSSICLIWRRQGESQ